jgi:type IX secretion system PorP/SprF family membrane protein
LRPFLRPLFLLLLAISSYSISKGQDVHFSQFYNQPLILNPAFAGLNYDLRVGVQGQKLYYKIPYSFSASNFVIDKSLPLAAGGGGIGLLVTQDVAGAGLLKTNSAELAYSYKIVPFPASVTRKYDVLQFGLKFGAYQHSIDASRLILNDQLDPVAGLVRSSASSLTDLASINNKIYPDFSVGALYRFNHYKRGKDKNIRKINATQLISVSYSHMMRPDEGLLNTIGALPSRLSLHYSLALPLHPHSRDRMNELIYLAAIYQMQFGNRFQEMMYGANIKERNVYFGLGWRKRNFYPINKNVDALIFATGVEYIKMHNNKSKVIHNYIAYRFGYNYDFTVNRLIGASGGSHEISLSFCLLSRKKFKFDADKGKGLRSNCYYF